MLLRLSLAILTAAVLPASAAEAAELKSFRLSIGEQTVEIEPGDTVDVTLPDGSKTKVTLKRNDFATYSAGTFSFNYPTSLNVARSDVGDGIVQHLMASALGTLVIVQEYSSLNPLSLTDLMMQELTKETVGAGGTRTDQPIEHRLADGEVLKGIRSTIVYSGDTSLYEVLTFGAGDAGIVAVTRIDEKRLASEGVTLTTFWGSLDLK